jgi:hypothetical protein
MSWTFAMTIRGNAESLVKKAQAAARGAGASFCGDENTGAFAGSGVRGRYARSGSALAITIEDKPWLAPRSLVESKIREFFA